MIQQAPIVLSTGAVARYPQRSRTNYATRAIKFADFSRQTFSQLANPLSSFDINLSMLQDSERSDWFDFFQSQVGGAQPFVFAEAGENLLYYSEQFENAVWIPSSANIFVGNNYLLNSQQFTAASWTVSNTGASNPTVTDNAATAPDGTSTAASVAFPSVPNTPGDGSFLFQNATVPATQSQSFTFSVWLRVASGTGSIQIVAEDSPVSQSSTTTCSLTTTWQRFSVTVNFNSSSNSQVRALIQNPSNSSAVTVQAWGAQVEYGPVVSDYTATTTAITPLQIADPFFQQAPSTTPGYQWNLNSQMTRRGRQIACISTANIAQTLNPLYLSGAGRSRKQGMTLTASLWMKSNGVSTPSVELDFGDSLGYEFGAIVPAITASWARYSGTKTFSASNPGAITKYWLTDRTAASTFYVFGAQLEIAGTASGYKDKSSYSGYHPKCFLSDSFGNEATEFNQNNVTLSIEESN